MKKKETNQKSKNKRTIREVLAVLRKYDISSTSDAHSIRLALEELGPTFVKLGQLLATQSDLFPAELCEELRGLRDEVAPMTTEEIDSILFEAYGKPKEEVFTYFDEDAHGSASISQVHRATLKTGEDVAVKIQRIGARESMEKDIAFIRRLLRRIPFIKNNRYIDINEVIDELADITHFELDFTHEAANLQRFRELNDDIKYVSCPEVYPELTTETVLVMEYINGFKITDKEALEENGYDLNEIGRKYITSFLKQTFEDGFFQADPHAGNLKISDGKIVWYDLGMMGEFPDRNRDSFNDVIEGFITANNEKCYDGYLKMCYFPPKFDKEELFKDISALSSSISRTGLENIDVNAQVKEFMRIAKKHHARLDPAQTMMSRGLATVQGTIEEVFPELDFFQEIKSYAVKARLAELKNKNKDKEIEMLKRYTKMKKIASIPENLSVMIEQLSRGLSPLKIEMGVPEKSQPFITNIVAMLVNSLIIVALLVSSSIIVLSDIKPQIWGMPVLGVIGYSIAVLMILFNLIKRMIK